MPKRRARANELSRLANPITDYDNQRVDGLALCSERNFKEKIEEAQALRAQHADYIESLPKKPEEAIQRAMQYLWHDFGDYPEGFQEALHLSAILADALRNSNPLDNERQPDAAIYVADRIEVALTKASAALNRATDALRNPARYESSAQRV